MPPLFLGSAMRDNLYITKYALVGPQGIWPDLSCEASKKYTITEADKRSVDYDLSNFIGSKGLRFHDKSSKLAMTAVRILLDNLDNIDRYTMEDLSVVVGSDGALTLQYQVVAEALNNPRMMNPRLYPNRGCNVIAGQISLMFGLHGESTVVSSGYNSGVDSLIYASRKCLINNTLSYVVAGGESIGKARHLRTSLRSSKDGDEVKEIEAGFACLVENQSIGNRTHNPKEWNITAFLQRSIPGKHIETAISDFAVDNGFSMEEIHRCIYAVEGCGWIRNGSDIKPIPYDIYGGTILTAFFESVSKPSSNGQTMRCILANLDRHGMFSTVLLINHQN
ncbi:MAG: hypothetical protein H7832_09485 [Magnetococcus sp. DMHC-6]